MWLDPATAEALAWRNLAEQVDAESLVGTPVVVSSDTRVQVELAGSVELTLLGVFGDDGGFEFVVRAESGPLAG